MKDYSVSVDQRLRDRFMYLALIICLYKIISQIPVPFLSVNVLLDNFSVLTRLNNTQLSPVIPVGLAGVAPYLYASSMIEFASLSVPALKKNRELGGTIWVKQINLWKRYLATGFIVVSTFQKCNNLSYGIFNLSSLDIAILMSVFISGGLFIIWMAETLSIYTVSLGSNILIALDILSDIGRLSVAQSFGANLLIPLALILWGILVLTEAQRKLPLVISRITDVNQNTWSPTGANKPGIDDYLSISLLPGGSTLSILTLAFCLFITGFIQSFTRVELRLGLTILSVLIYYFLAKSFVDFALNTEEIAKSLRKMSVNLYGVKSGPFTLKFLNELKSVLFLIPLSGTGLFILVPFLLSTYIKGVENSLFSFIPSLFLIYSIYNDLFYKISAFLKIND